MPDYESQLSEAEKRVSEYESSDGYIRYRRWQNAVANERAKKGDPVRLVIRAGIALTVLSLGAIPDYGIVPTAVCSCIWLVPEFAFGFGDRRYERRASKRLGYSPTDEDREMFYKHADAIVERDSIERRISDERDAERREAREAKEAEDKKAEKARKKQATTTSSYEREAYLAEINGFHYAPNKYAGKSAKVQNRHNPTICPKCGSRDTMVLGSGKKVSVGRAVVGGAVGSMVNPVGTAVGAGVGAMTGKRNRTEMVCRTCGARWYI